MGLYASKHKPIECYIKFQDIINFSYIYIDDNKKGKPVWCRFYPDRVIIQQETVKYTKSFREKVKYMPACFHQPLTVRVPSGSWFVVHPDSSQQFVDHVCTSMESWESSKKTLL